MVLLRGEPPTTGNHSRNKIGIYLLVFLTIRSWLPAEGPCFAQDVPLDEV